MTLLDLVITDTTWTTVCHIDDLGKERGSAALVNGRQVALFRLIDDTVHAIQQHDPYSGAYVMSRGLVGSRGDVSTVTSPMYKQVFDLRTGDCLDPIGKQQIALRVHPVRIVGGLVQVEVDARDTENESADDHVPSQTNAVPAGAGSAA